MEPREARRAPVPIAAVIVQHGDPSLGVRALASVRASRGAEILPVLVDHGPGDGSLLADVAAKAGGLYLRPGSNLGFAGGINLGIREVQARGGAGLFMLMNHDAVLDPDAAAILAQRFREIPDLGVLGPTIVLGSKPATIWNAGSEIEWPSARPRSLGNGRPAGDLPVEVHPVGFVCGCTAMVRSTVLERIGLLDESFFLCFEDADFSYRARRAGYAVCVEPRARVSHDPGSAVGKLPDLGAYCRVRGRILFSRRWAPAGLSPRLRRILFSLARLPRGSAERRGALDGLLGRSGPPPEDLFQKYLP